MKHITIILPIAYRGGSLRVTKTVAKMLKSAGTDLGGGFGVRIAVLDGYYDILADFADVIAAGIEVREFSWNKITKRELENILAIQGREKRAFQEEYVVPSDGINDLMDSDLWLLISDRVPLPLAPVKAFSVFATDFIQRYVPEIFPVENRGTADMPGLLTLRHADAVITTTPQTRLDAISYVGLPAAKVHLAPMDFDPTWMPDVSSKAGAVDDRSYILWPTNPTPHKNHVRALEALSEYYETLGGQLKVKVVGPNSERLCPGGDIGEDRYSKRVQEVFGKHSALAENVSFLGELSDHRYADVLSRAAFLWHPTIVDNGTFAVAEAAWYGCPSLSSGYPQMRYIADRFAIPVEFFNAQNVKEMARALKRMESTAQQLREQLPARDVLSTHSWERHSDEFRKIVTGIIS